MYIPNSSIAAMICSTQMSLGTEEVACCFSLNIDGHGLGGSGGLRDTIIKSQGHAKDVREIIGRWLLK